jgi:hypothetical protein
MRGIAFTLLIGVVAGGPPTKTWQGCTCRDVTVDSCVALRHAPPGSLLESAAQGRSLPVDAASQVEEVQWVRPPAPPGEQGDGAPRAQWFRLLRCVR